MELAAIITTLLVVVLQIITIALVVGTRKIVRDQVGKTNSALSNEKNSDRKERDFRVQNRKPLQEQRQKPTNQQPATTGSVDTVEKSLRDINLKLKNAERDQEFARRKVQENFSKDPNRRNNGNDRNNNRGGRDNRDHHHGHGNNRDRRGGNWQDRNKNREPLSFGPAQPAAEHIEESQNIEKLNPILAQDQIQQVPSQEPTVQPTQAIISESAPDLAANDFSTDENLQHGRKIMVKRRMLKEDEESGSENNEESSSSEGSSASIQSEVSVSEDSNVVEKAPEGEIRFGRR